MDDASSEERLERLSYLQYFVSAWRVTEKADQNSTDVAQMTSNRAKSGRETQIAT